MDQHQFGKFEGHKLELKKCTHAKSHSNAFTICRISTYRPNSDAMNILRRICNTHKKVASSAQVLRVGDIPRGANGKVGTGALG
jgi:hypothetical protein